MSYKDFETKLLGQVVDTDGYPKGHPYQCADLIKQYMHDEFGLPFGAYGDAVNYWQTTHPVVLTKFDRYASQDPKQGDLVVLAGVNGNIFGHIGISTEDWPGGDTVEILEQNGSTGNGLGKEKDRIRKRRVPRSRIMGLLRPKKAIPISDKSYVVNVDMPAYYTSLDARDRRNQRGIVRPRTYAVFNEANGMINVTREAGSPGSWVNPGDNKAPLPAPAPPAPPAPQSVPAPQPRVHTVVANDSLSKIARQYGLPSWRVLYEKNRNVIGTDPNIIRPGQKLVIP